MAKTLAAVLLGAVICCVIAVGQNSSQASQPQQDQPSHDQAGQGQSQPPEAPQNQPDQNQTPKPQPDTTQPEARKKSDIPLGVVGGATKKLGKVTFNKVVDWESGWFTGPYVGKNREMVAMSGQQRSRIYLDQTLAAPSDYFKRMLSAGFDQWRDSPSQWGQGWEAYGERFASREGQFISANSVAALGDAVLGYEPRYDQCKCSGFRARTRHAILRNFLTYNRSEQEQRPQWALYGGAFAGGVIATEWKPHPRNALLNGGFGVLGQAGYGALLNFFTEFAGDINRKLGKKR